jgi:hypothetical protein
MLELALHPKSIEPTSLYDLIETHEEMTLLVVKKQLNHFIIKKIMKDHECKDPLAWWRTHEI